MSRQHPIIAVTGSSGAGLSTIRHAFKFIFQCLNIKPVSGRMANAKVVFIASTPTPRLAAFALEVEPSKTTLLRFGRYVQRQCAKLGEKRPPNFDFLGFTHYATESRRKRFLAGRKTQGSRVARKLKEVGVRLPRLRTPNCAQAADEP